MTSSRHATGLALTLLAFASPALAAPTISSVFPSSGPTAGGTVLTINGSNFSMSGNSVALGGEPCEVDQQDEVRITCSTPEGTGANNDVVVTDDAGTASNAASFSYDPPSLVSLSPNHGPTSGGTVLTLTGSNFGPVSADAKRSVSFVSPGGGSSSCEIVAGGGSHVQVRCETPAGQGAGQSVSITVDGQTSGVQSFSYDAPEITGVAPAAASTAGGTRLTISGSSFGLSASALVGGAACPVDAQTDSSIECTAPSGAAGPTSVLVVVEGQVSPPFAHAYAAPPAIASIFPASAPTAGSIPLTINGANFSATGNSATVGGRACAISAEGALQIVCDVPEGTGLGRQVQVVSADGLDSNTTPLDYDPPAVTSVEPASAATSGNIPITIRGQNFGPAEADALRSVLVGTSPCPLLASSSGHTEIQCTLPEGQGLGRTVGVTVDGQSTSPLTSGTIDYDAPAITSLSPTEGPAAGGTVLTIHGSSFGLTASVAIDGNACPVTGQTHETLTCTIPPGSGVDRPLVVAVSGQLAMTTFDYREQACGDGFVDGDEDCDDTNENDLDGCSAACETERTQDRDQAGCIVALNKAGAGVFKAQGKDVQLCARRADGTDCVGAASSTTLAKAEEKVATAETKKCATAPDFGRAPVSVVQDAASAEQLALAVDLFGADPDAALAPDAMAPERADCQQRVLKAVHKLADARLKAFGKCKKGGFAAETIRAPSQLAACLATIDADDRLDKPAQAVATTLVERCVDVSVDPATAFPGACASAPDVGACIEDRVRCRTCRAVVATDGLDDDCDGYDDGALNGSCQ